MNIEREAIVVLAERGWRKAGEPFGGECLHLAMATASGRPGSRAYDAALARVLGVIAEQFPERYKAHWLHDTVLWRFNDHPDTTLDDVVAVLEKAAVRRDEMA